MKLIVAAVIFVLGVGRITWNLFLSDMLAHPEAHRQGRLAGRRPPTPEQEQQNQAVKKKVDEQIKGYEKKFGGGGSVQAPRRSFQNSLMRRASPSRAAGFLHGPLPPPARTPPRGTPPPSLVREHGPAFFPHGQHPPED